MANSDQSLIHRVCLDKSPTSPKCLTGGIGLFSDIIPLGVKIDLAQQYFNSGPCGVETPYSQDVQKHMAGGESEKETWRVAGQW